MSNKTEIKISRTTAQTRISGLEKLRTYEFHRGEIVTVNLGYNSLLAVGIGDGIGPEYFRVVSLYQNQVCKKVYNTDPGEELRAGCLWRANDGNWFFGNEPLANSLYTQTTFNDIDSGCYFLIGRDGVPRMINDVYEKEEVDAKISSIIVQSRQADWNEEDLSSLSYIRNKPMSVRGMTEDITYRIIQDEPNTFSLYKTFAENEPEKVGVSVKIPEDDHLVSGSVIYDEDEPFLNLRLESGESILVSFASLIDIYYQGIGVEIDENNSISILISPGNGLRVDPEDGLTVDPVTTTTPGAMTPEDKAKLDSLDESVLVKTADLLNGSTRPLISKFTKGIDAPASDGRIVEWPGFTFRTTAGNLNIKTGEAELREIKGNVDQSYNAFKPSFFVSTGNNALNPENIFQNKEIDENGNIIENENHDIYYFKALGDTVYNIFTKNGNEPVAVGISTEKDNTHVDLINPDNTFIYTSPYEGWILVCTERGDIPCARIKWSGSEDGIFEDYNESRIPLGQEAVYYKIGDMELYDRWFDYNGEIWFEKKFDKVNINSWGAWYYSEDRKAYYKEYTGAAGRIKENTEFVFGLPGLSIYGSSILFYAKNTETIPPTGIVYFELAKTEIIKTAESSIYIASDYGTEGFEDDQGNTYILAPRSITTEYTPNLFDDLRHLQENLDTKLNKSEVDNAMSDSSERLVQNKVVKKYIDDVVAAAKTGMFKDVSKRDALGNVLNSMNTANCYVISEPGYYKLPLVYGNAIKNGEPNTSAYTNKGGNEHTDYVNYEGAVITSPYIETDSATAYSAGLVWQDVQGMIENINIISGSPCRYITFSVNNVPILGGNAIICVRDANTDIMWSWHIWCYPDSLAPISIWNSLKQDGVTGGTEYKCMPVNLGCVWNAGKTRGMNVYYQWGRKDPMPRSSTYDSTENVTLYNGTYGVFGSDADQSKNKTIANSIKNPNLFFPEYDTSNYNWLAPINGIASPYNLWDAYGRDNTSDNTTIKTIYDPCPYGWKVPNGAVFKGFTKTEGNTETKADSNAVNPPAPTWKKGWDFWRYDSDPSGVFFPASGYRSRTSGSLGSVSSLGYYWSSASRSSTNAYHLYFSSGRVYPVNSNYRAYGFSVRPFLE